MERRLASVEMRQGAVCGSKHLVLLLAFIDHFQARLFLLIFVGSWCSCSILRWTRVVLLVATGCEKFCFASDSVFPLFRSIWKGLFLYTLSVAESNKQ